MRDLGNTQRKMSQRRLTALLATVLAVLGVALIGLSGTPVGADTIRDQQWQLAFLHAKDAWRWSDGANVTVAVIDSGVDATHPDLVGQVLPGTDFVDGSTDGRTDVVGHGTAVAAFIAGRGDDQNGVVGLAYGAKILPIRVLDPKNEYDSASTIAKAIHWAVDHGADVINLSLGSADTAPVLTEALHYAFRRDVVVVACDGNISNDRGATVWHPAREPGVIAVSGVTRSGAFWTGSLQGPATVLSAPATDLTAAGLDHGYWRVQGTSFGTPMVSAAAALIRSRFPTLSAANVVNRLIQTAVDTGPVGRDAEFGYGEVDPAAALSTTVPVVSRNPLLAPPDDNQAGGGPPPVTPAATGAAEVPAPPTPAPTVADTDTPLATKISSLRSRAVLVGLGAAVVLALASIAAAGALLKRRR